MEVCWKMAMVHFEWVMMGFVAKVVISSFLFFYFKEISIIEEGKIVILIIFNIVNIWNC